MEPNENQMKEGVHQLIQRGASLLIDGQSASGKTDLLQSITDGLENSLYLSGSVPSSLAQGCPLLRLWLLRPPNQTYDVVLIDNIEAVSIEHFEKLVSTCGKAQYILAGDFQARMPGGVPVFECDTWKELIGDRVVQLVHSPDPLARLLSEVRMGTELSPASQQLIESRKVAIPESIQPVNIVNYDRVAALINKNRLRELPGKDVVFDAIDWYDETDKAGRLCYDEMIQKSLLETKLHLKVGAQVLMVGVPPFHRDINHGQVAVVVAISKKQGVYVQTASDQLRTVLITPQVIEVRSPWDPHKVVARRVQLPMQLGWAATLYRTQGMRIDQVSIDLSVLWSHSQVYSTLSRAHTPEGLFIKEWVKARTQTPVKSGEKKFRQNQNTYAD
jgi:energy-coupling factor transporter ATP-binding protein EcfA2